MGAVKLSELGNQMERDVKASSQVAGDVIITQHIFINLVQIIPVTRFSFWVPHTSCESQEILTLLQDFGKGWGHVHKAPNNSSSTECSGNGNSKGDVPQAMG